MRTVNVHEAKTHLSRLLDAVAGGEEIVIAKAGRPVATLAPLRPKPTEASRNLASQEPPVEAPRRLGFMAGQFTVPDDFDEMFADEIAEMFGMKD